MSRHIASQLLVLILIASHSKGKHISIYRRRGEKYRKLSRIFLRLAIGFKLFASRPKIEKIIFSMSSQALDFISTLVICCHERTKLLTVVYLHEIKKKIAIKVILCN